MEHSLKERITEVLLDEYVELSKSILKTKEQFSKAHLVERQYNCAEALKLLNGEDFTLPELSEEEKMGKKRIAIENGHVVFPEDWIILNEDAAKMLSCTKANIRWHLSKILDKTGYRTRMELLIAVASKNLIIVTPDKALEDNDS